MYEYTLKLGELHWAQVCILVDVEERDKEDETSINIQRRRGRLSNLVSFCLGGIWQKEGKEEETFLLKNPLGRL